MTEWFEKIGVFFSNWWNDLSAEFYQNFIYNDRWLQLLDGLTVTLYITLGAVVLGIILGILLALLRLSRNKLACGFAKIYLTVFRGTPLLIQLLIINYVVFSGIRIPPVIVAIIAFGMNSGAYVAEIVRSGILSVDHGQTEAARSLGFNQAQTMRYIVLPQAFKNILPTLANEVIVLLKETSIVGYITITDLTRAGDLIRSRTFSAFMPLIGVAIVYLLMTTLLSFIFGKIERRMRAHDTRS
ncbi:MAG: amino acid ABC transporter permease [Clostridiales bacterium]|nr:MAG: amino acid ABC transporter permease [Clostridiales bacterium]